MSLGPRVLRILTHINIGATLGIGAWLIWSSMAVALAPPIKSAARPMQVHPLLSPETTQPCDCRSHRHRVHAMTQALAVGQGRRLAELQS